MVIRRSFKRKDREVWHLAHPSCWRMGQADKPHHSLGLEVFASFLQAEFAASMC